MGWFTKKDNRADIEKMPALPELPDSPNTGFILPETQSQNPPELPQMPEQESFSQIPPVPGQRLTRDYVEQNQKTIINEPKPGMQKSRFDSPQIEMPEQPIENFGISKIDYKNYQPPKNLGISSTPGSFKPLTKSFAKKDESVYIRLDKFQITMEAFRDIKNKIREIEELLSRTKEIKAREEKEIEEWEREIETIKLKLDSIDKEISAPEN